MGLSNANNLYRRMHEMRERFTLPDLYMLLATESPPRKLGYVQLKDT